MKLLFIPLQTTEKKKKTKKRHGVGFVYVLLSRLTPFYVFNFVVNRSICCRIHDILSLCYIFTERKPFLH